MKPLLAILIAVLAVTLPTHGYAQDEIALNSSLAEDVAPTTLRSARDVELELIPEITRITPDSIITTNSPAGDLWQRIRGGFAMSELNSPLIAKHERWYADRPDYVMRMTERAGRYLYYITEEVERRGMPSEIALLPMIESAFNPGAYSTSSASGIWQFIPSTGKNFGMQQNWWYDERRDIISATSGALDYLQKLHGMFGDWQLALAAYNWGENAVQRAQDKNRKRGLPISYTSLKMPPETRNYVPKLLAIKNIVANPAHFGLVLNDIPDQPYFATVITNKQMDVELAAQLADISSEEFIALNPGHNRPVILQGGSDTILLPVNKVQTFQENLDSYDKPLVSWQAYQPKKGERLDKLAPRFGLSVAQLKSVNGLGRNNISTGQTLLVPVSDEEGDTADELTPFNMHLVPDDQGRVIRHVVRKGETPSGIAKRYKVSLASLKKSNRNLKIIRPGQIIIVRQKSGNKNSSHVATSASAVQKRANKSADIKPTSSPTTPAQIAEGNL